ncbi:MAG TPA: MFS transporter [Geobacteraceae bacterium]|nr:MFS transporter [Geobacteraceae bacterium]
MTSTLHGKKELYRLLIFWVLAVSYILVYFHRLCPAVVAVDMMHDLHASGALIGFLSSAYFYPYALMQIPAGLLSDSWGPRRTISLFFVFASAGSLLLGLAPSPFWAIVGRILVGLGVSTLFVSTLKTLAEWFHARKFATMTGILMAMGGVGSYTAAAPLALLSSRFGWRFSFVLVAILTLFMALLVWFIVRDKPSDIGLPSPAEHAPANKPTEGILKGMGKVLSEAAFWPIAIWFFFDCAVFFSFGGLWGGPWLMHVYGLSKAQAGQILSMLAVGMMIGSPLLSRLSDRVFRGRKTVIILSSAVSLLLTGFLAFATDTLTTSSLYLICFGLGIFSSSIAVIGFTATKELFPARIAGTATGLVNFFPFAGGAVFQPVLGWILEKHGRVAGKFPLESYREAFLTLFICAAIALLASFFVRETMTE